MLSGDNISEFNNDSGYITSSALSNYVPKTSTNRPGVTRLYRRDDDSGYSVQTSWTGSYWLLEGYNGNDGYHAGCQVAYANSAGSASSAGNADTLDNHDSSYFYPASNPNGYTSVTSSTVSGWGFTKNAGTVTSVSAGTGLSISGTASVTPTINIASGYKLPTTTEWSNKADTSALSNYVLKTGDTMSGKLQVNAAIFGYNYTNSNSKAAFTFDKPGSNYTGIGAHGISDTIWFGACSNSDGAWEDSYKQKWQFNGETIAEKVTVNAKVTMQYNTTEDCLDFIFA